MLFWTGGFSLLIKRSPARVYCIQASGKSVTCFEKLYKGYVISANMTFRLFFIIIIIYDHLGFISPP